MDKDDFITPVIFRKENNEVKDILAVFPEQLGSNDPNTCGCYSHIGQHSVMSISYLNMTKPARPQEYSDLKQELESIGYNLKVYKRWQMKFDYHRKKTLENYK